MLLKTLNSSIKKASKYPVYTKVYVTLTFKLRFYKVFLYV